MDPHTLHLLTSSFAALEPRLDELVARFYEQLFVNDPSLRPLFKDDLMVQTDALAKALRLVVGSLEDVDRILPVLYGLGERHAGYGVKPDHYGLVRDTLLDAMAELAGELWTEELGEAWTGALNLVAGAMLEGAERAA